MEILKQNLPSLTEGIFWETLYIRSAHEKKRIRGKIFGERKYLVSRGKEKRKMLQIL